MGKKPPPRPDTSSQQLQFPARAPASCPRLPGPASPGVAPCQCPPRRHGEVVWTFGANPVFPLPAACLLRSQCLVKRATPRLKMGIVWR
ncbi:hypothetical protein GQ607_011553 [Colletotrichum asianum]|uniref:Uncharacterized protein n=1 Tax=Colletotrichum asianum TaxID=702518 RepID=A0A8H3W4L7_9PEZI|nr:hypothetical protein GQ607_011553 [Colletotrichum asianum]